MTGNTTRIFIEVHEYDQTGLFPDSWELPDDATAGDVVALLQTTTSPEHAIHDFNLLVHPVIEVTVVGPHGTTKATWQ